MEARLAAVKISHKDLENSLCFRGDSVYSSREGSGELFPLLEVKRSGLMVASVIGLPDPWIWLAYLLSLAATALCVIFAVVRGRKDDSEPTQVDAAWVAHEKEVEEENWRNPGPRPARAAGSAPRNRRSA